MAGWRSWTPPPPSSPAPSGTGPDGVWSAPGRVNLIGEHTDYNGGLALPIALPQRTYAAVRLRDHGRLRAVSTSARGGIVEVALDDIEPGRPQGWAAYLAGVCWVLRQEGHAVPGLDIAIASDVPVGAGLSSSAALECALVAALSDLLGTRRARRRRRPCPGRGDGASAPRTRSPVRRPEAWTRPRRCGPRADHAILLDCRSGAVEQVPVDLSSHGLALLVVDTRAEHALVDGQYAARRAACEDAA